MSSPMHAAFSVIALLRLYFTSPCVLLLYTDDAEYAMALRKPFIDSHVQIAMVNMSLYTNTHAIHGATRCLHVYAGSTRVNTYLRQHPSLVARSTVWLFLLPRGTASQLVEGIPVPFDSHVLVAQESPSPSPDEWDVMEVYRVSPEGSVNTRLWGRYSHGNISVYGDRRRRTLEGYRLTAAVAIDPPYIIGRDEEGTWTGIAADLFTELQGRLNFTIDVEEPRNGLFGALQEDGRWNGVVGLLQSRRADISMSALTMTSARARVISFSAPITITRSSVFIRRPTAAATQLTAFLTPFSSGLWLAVMVTLLLLSVSLAVADCLAHNYSVYSVYSDTHTHTGRQFPLYDSLLCMWGCFCLQGCTISPHSWGCRLLLWLSYMAGLTLLAAYNANFISCLTVRQDVLPFSGLQGLLKDAGYGFSVMADSGLLTNFQTSSDPVEQRIYRQLIHPHESTLPRNSEEGLRLVCGSRPHAFMDSYLSSASVTDRLSCEVSLLPQTSFLQFLSLGFPRDSPYRDTVNQLLQTMRPLGILDRINHRNIPLRASKTKLPFSPVTVWDVLPICLLWVSGFALSLVVVLAERCYTHFVGERDGSSGRVSPQGMV